MGSLCRPPHFPARLSPLFLLILAAFAPPAGSQQSSPPPPPADIVFRGATVMTASHGTIQQGAVWVHAGKIAGVGATVSAPESAAVIDATGMWLTPGIIDPHSHSALDSDVNEATSPVTPSMHMIDAFDNRSADLYRALAGGVTTELLLHGSANMIGGQAVVIKNKFGPTAKRCCSPTRPVPSSSRRARIRSESMAAAISCPPREWETSK
jgi:imidazolonepropionase-like amidohydrolase